MQLAGSPSWRISEDRWPESFEWALWFRVAERIDVASAAWRRGRRMLSRCRTRARTRRTPPSWRRAVTGRWREAHDWHTARMKAGHEAGADRDVRIGRAVADLERELGRKAPPFSLDFVLLPVRDDQVRQIGPDRYLVPERLHDGPRWPELLRALLIPRA